jgi:hypothetical protein
LAARPFFHPRSPRSGGYARSQYCAADKGGTSSWT